MNQNAKRKARAKKWTPVGALFSLLGVVLFVYFVEKAGVREITYGIRRLGAGFLIVLGIAGIRFAARAFAWTRCFEAPYRMRFRDAFQTFVTSDAVGTIAGPLNIVVAEPTKAAFVRDRVPLMPAVSAIAIELLFYSLSVALVILTGAIALLLNFSLPNVLRIASLGALIATLVIIPCAYLVVRRQLKFVSGALGLLNARGVGRKWLADAQPRVSALEDRVYNFYAQNPTRFITILLLEFCFHLAGVAEIYIVLLFISDAPPTLLAAFALEWINRLVNVVFKPVPLRIGVDEAVTGFLTNALHFGTGVGVTLAIIRKARVICWTALGVLFLIKRGLSLKTLTEEAEAVNNDAQASSNTAASES
jgi:hypothetical protein